MRCFRILLIAFIIATVIQLILINVRPYIKENVEINSNSTKPYIILEEK